MFNDKIYKLTSIAGAFLLWGSWAFYINPGTFSSRVSYALCQGLISGTATALMISALKFLKSRFNNLFLPPLIVTASTTVIASSCHYLIGTPEIIATLSPAVCAAFSFCLITSIHLDKKSARECK